MRQRLCWGGWGLLPASPGVLSLREGCPGGFLLGLGAVVGEGSWAAVPALPLCLAALGVLPGQRGSPAAVN